MSGLEVVGTVASIIQIIDIGARVIKRINDYREKANTLPGTFYQIGVQLPIFIEVVRDTKLAIDENRLSDTARKALNPLITECNSQIRILDLIVHKVLPLDVYSTTDRLRKAYRSLKYESEVAQAETTLRKYIEAMSHQRIAASRNEGAIVSDPPRPSFVNKPFNRDADHVHRAALDWVITQTHRPNGTPRLALVGLGGVGKSQIALQYAYITKEVMPDVWIFWARASSVARLEADFRQIARALHLPGWDEKDTHIFQSVYEWLSNEANGRWVMIIDNADDPSVLTAPPPCGSTGFEEPNDTNSVSHSATAQIWDFLPTSSLGTILMTSRTKEVAFDLTGNHNHYTEVEEMTQTEAMELLTKKLRGEFAESDKLQLINRLGNMPLAISQAAAYISRRSPLITIADYVEKLDKGDEDAVTLLTESTTESHRERQRSHSIMKTWHLTFQYVRRASPTAARLLSLMCMFDRQGIEKSILIGQYDEKLEKEEEKSDQLSTIGPRRLWARVRKAMRRLKIDNDQIYGQTVFSDTPSAFIDDCATLSDFSLVKVTADGQGFALHRLVQFATQKWLEIHHELERWSGKFIVLLEKYYPKPDFDGWQACQNLFPHAMRAIRCMPPDVDILHTWLILILKVASFVQEIGLWTEAVDYNRLAIGWLVKLLGSEHEHTLQGIHQLGSALNARGDLEESETLLRQAWLDRQRLFGQENEDALSSARSLRLNLRKQGKLEEAVALDVLTRNIAKRKRAGRDQSREALPKPPEALDLTLNGQFAEAELIRRQTLDTRQKPWSEEALGDIENVVDLLTLQRKYREAASLLRESLAIQTRSNSADEDNIAATKAKLASVLACHGHYLEAEQLLRQLIATAPTVQASLNQQKELTHWQEYLGAVLARQGHFAEAETIGKQALDATEKILGKVDNRTLNAAHTLAEIMRLQGRYDEALALYKRAHPVAYLDRLDTDVIASHLHWMTDCVNDIRSIVKTEGGDETCWERMNKDDASLEFTYLA
ncbi:unnamed protein product [Periconia digitata]|uniref:NACHT-NTPase and P-loop NTPases N-terminal domain-containing protein n=1 Tax=Periconia digitata TaxID=1303443 RepID=A0A9W4XTX1_9PLEO|nr:unnamed protein product [Periconia digitata]